MWQTAHRSDIDRCFVTLYAVELSQPPKLQGLKFENFVLNNKDVI